MERHTQQVANVRHTAGARVRRKRHRMKWGFRFTKLDTRRNGQSWLFMGGPSIPPEWNKEKLIGDKAKQRPMGTSAERARDLSTIGTKTSWGDKSVYKFNNLPKRTARVAQSDSDSLRPSADSLSCFIDGKKPNKLWHLTHATLNRLLYQTIW